MPGAGKKTVAEFLKMKQRGEKIVMMTAYDAPTAAIAAEAGVALGLEEFDRLHRKVPVLCGMKTAGRWPTQMFWYAGGVPRIMRELRELLHLDVMTVTGHTLGENLEILERQVLDADGQMIPSSHAPQGWDRYRSLGLCVELGGRP